MGFGDCLPVVVSLGLSLPDSGHRSLITNYGFRLLVCSRPKVTLTFASFATIVWIFLKAFPFRLKSPYDAKTLVVKPIGRVPNTVYQIPRDFQKLECRTEAKILFFLFHRFVLGLLPFLTPFIASKDVARHGRLYKLSSILTLALASR